MPTHFVNVIPLTSLPHSKPQSYIYKIDGDFEIGQLVEINFANRNIWGVVVGGKNDQLNKPPTPQPPLSGGLLENPPLIRGVEGVTTENSQTKKMHPPYIPYDSDLTKKAQTNRKTPTKAEKKIWEFLRGRHFENYKFTRQKPLDNFIVDFYCQKLMLVIEIDGGSHGEKKIYDEQRTKILARYGLQVVRYNNEKIECGIDGVYQDLTKKIKSREIELGLKPPNPPYQGGECRANAYRGDNQTPQPPLSGGRVQSQCLSGRQSNPPTPLIRGASADFSLAKIKKINRTIDNIKLTSEQLKLAKSVANYYHTSLGLVLKLMVPPVLKKPQTKKQTNPPSPLVRGASAIPEIILTDEQAKIIDDVKTSQNKTHLLYGITGSGKTEIYLRLIEDAIKQGKQSIILVPEISLTPQAIERYSERFGQDNIVLFHSNISKTEKFLVWQKIRNNEVKIVIGTRSAIFVPIKNLAYIIIDEEHDSSYKQYDQNPRYNAKKVANFLSEIFQAKIILGSATPNIDSYYAIENNLHKLTKRISGDLMPKVDIVDMRDEFKKGNFTIFSDLLQDKIAENLQNKKQIILYLNRRGAATFVFCRDCGFVEKCPYCDLPLTYHIKKNVLSHVLRGRFGDVAEPTRSHNLICHHCGFNKTISLACPNCKSAAFKYFGCGTQKIESELTKLFGAIKILRMDRDTTQNREIHQKFYKQFKNREYDILVGTQMITKGWDLPNVGLVGIISADTTLNLPDFRSGERTFQLITQVAGRTGRGVEVGEVVLQTYSPDNFAIKAAAKHDFDSFYKEEIVNRKNLNYPPFTRLVKLFFRHQDKNKARQTADSLFEKLNNKAKEFGCDSAMEFIGPFPAFISKVGNNFIYQIIIKIKSASWRIEININALLNEVPSSWIIDIDPESLL